MEEILHRFCHVDFLQPRTPFLRLALLTYIHIYICTHTYNMYTYIHIYRNHMGIRLLNISPPVVDVVLHSIKFGFRGLRSKNSPLFCRCAYEPLSKLLVSPLIIIIAIPNIIPYMTPFKEFRPQTLNPSQTLIPKL